MAGDDVKSGSDIAKQKAAERQRKLKAMRAQNRMRFLIVVCTLFFTIFGGRFLYNSHFFDVSEISVKGSKHLSTKAVVTLSGVSKGTNLYKIPLEDVEKRIEKSPWVKSVSLSRRPLKTLVIEITERTPIAIVTMKKDSFYVDEDGWVIGAVSKIDSTVPRIADLPVNLNPGQRITAKGFENAISCLKNLDPELKRKIGIISAASPEKISLYVSAGEGNVVEVLYGSSEDSEKKNKVIKTILSQKKGQLLFMDVRMATNPIVKRQDAKVAQ